MYFKSGFVHSGRWGVEAWLHSNQWEFCCDLHGPEFHPCLCSFAARLKSYEDAWARKRNLESQYCLQTVGVKLLGKSQGNWAGIKVMCLAGHVLDGFFVLSISSLAAWTVNDVLQSNLICRELQFWHVAICDAFTDRGVTGSFSRSDNRRVQDNQKSEHT